MLADLNDAPRRLAMTDLMILPRELQSARGDCEYPGFGMTLNAE
jgi:hypothetical protein